MRIVLWNCFWLILPALVWNALFSGYLTAPVFASDENVPAFLMVLETVSRIAVFALPILIPIDRRGSLTTLGLWVLGAGYALYFASWLPHLAYPDSAFALSFAGVLAPYVTPVIMFTGVAIVGRSRWYMALASLFVAAHSLHAAYSYGAIG